MHRPDARVRHATRRAIFLDRDGVLNRNVFYPDTGAWESPRTHREFVLAPGVVPALCALRRSGFLLFLVSNQPNVVNGKSTRAELDAMHILLTLRLRAAGLRLDGAYYCCHHPRFTGLCRCRKPSPFFLLEAAQAYGLRLPACWLVGDRTTDMECGRAAGVRTAWVRTGQEGGELDPALYDVTGTSLRSVAGPLLRAAGLP